MVYSCNFKHYPPAYLIYSRLSQNTGCSLVLAPCRLSYNPFHIYDIDSPHRPKKPFSIVICSYGRSESLNATLKSLLNQTERNFEVILLTEKGNLSELRQRGLESSTGDIVTFIDDDVYCEPTWLRNITYAFQGDPKVLGITGPTTITDEYRSNRDIFKYRVLKSIHDWLFLKGLRDIPSRLSSCGCPSMASNDPDIEKFRRMECDYLEACNMSIRRKEALDAGGFDPIYTGTSEWCELDLALKVGHKGTFLFLPEARLFHRPSVQGIYGARLRTSHRWRNFKSFQEKWVKPSLLKYLYCFWVWAYLKMKGLRMI